jgi:hypothetical protein
MMILKDIGIARRGDARPNVRSRVISTQILGMMSDISIVKSSLLDSDDTLISLGESTVVLLSLLLLLPLPL